MSQKTYEDLVAENQKLQAENNGLKQENNGLKQENNGLKQENTELKIKVENQQLHINTLNRYIFGSKRESTPKEENIVEGTQCTIFGEVQDEELKQQIEEKREEIVVHRKKKTKKVASGIKKALTYTINHKENLSKFLTDGRIPLTNSRAERAVRPFAVHKKNWLFADTEEGAKANAIYYSIIESAKVNKLNIYKYIKYLLDELSQIEKAQEEKDIEKYLPWSKDLPAEILNYEGTYKEINVE